MPKRYFSERPKKALFFDLNRTLIDDRSSRRACFVSVLNEFTGRWDKEGTDWNPQQIALQYERQYERHLRKSLRLNKRRKLSTLKLQKASIRAVLKPYPLVVNDEFLRVFFKHMKQQQPHHYKLYPNTLNTLTKLSSSYKLGLISNRSNIDLARIGLSKHFTPDQIITPLNSKSRKPSSRIFRYAVSKLGVRPSEALMIGDSWKNDIIGATTAGLDAIWVRRGKGGDGNGGWSGASGGGGDGPGSSGSGARTGVSKGTRTSNDIAYRKLGKKQLLIIHNLEQLMEIL